MNTRQGELVWAGWLAVLLALELEALRRHRYPTLSYCLVRWLGLHPATRWRRLSISAFAGGWAALTVHLLWEANVYAKRLQ